MAMKKAEREALQREQLEAKKAFEQEITGGKYKFIAGVDEVGRGPLAGPVVAAAVVLPADFDVLGVDDSKKVSEKKRELLLVQQCQPPAWRKWAAAGCLLLRPMP